MLALRMNPAGVSSQRCAECGGEDIVTDHSSGDVICRGCGLVLTGRIIDEGPDWRSLAHDDRVRPDQARAGGKPSAIGASDTVISGGDEETLRTLRKIHMQTHFTSAERKILNHFEVLDNIGHRMNLPQSVVERAQQLFKQAVTTQCARGKNKEPAIIACLYIACRAENVPRTLQEFANITGADKKIIAKMFKALSTHLDVQPSTLRPEQLVHRYCSMLHITGSVVDACRQAVERVTNLGVCAGMSPQSVAGAMICCLADVTKQPVTLEEVAKVVLCSAKTLKNVGQTLCPHLEVCCPDWFVLDVKAAGWSFDKIPTLDWSKPKPKPTAPEADGEPVKEI